MPEAGRARAYEQRAGWAAAEWDQPSARSTHQAQARRAPSRPSPASRGDQHASIELGRRCLVAQRTANARMPATRSAQGRV